MHASLSKLREGYVKHLSPSEVKRGYVYISKEPQINEILCTNDFELKIADRIIVSRRIDRYGRIQVPCTILRELGTNQPLHFVVVSKNRLEITPSETDNSERLPGEKSLQS